MKASRREAMLLGTLPFVAIVVAWALLPQLVNYPAYMLPSIGAVLDSRASRSSDGSLLRNVRRASRALPPASRSAWRSRSRSGSRSR